MKDYYTKDKRRAYYLAWSARQKENPRPLKPKLCDCGSIAICHRGSEWICARCKQSETPAARTAVGLLTRHEGNMKWDELGIEVRRMLAVPDWMRHWCNRETAPEGNASELMHRITVTIVEKEHELVIHAHGEYHLKMPLKPQAIQTR